MSKWISSKEEAARARHEAAFFVYGLRIGKSILCISAQIQTKLPGKKVLVVFILKIRFYKFKK